MVKRLLARLAPLRGDRSAATAIEYALIALLVAIALIAAITSVGTSVRSMFASVAGGF
jgi:pilus assembly protein Flp/PilA